MRRRILAVSSAVVLATHVWILAAPGAPPGADLRLSGSTDLARAYNSILSARFDQASADLARACGPAPPEACDVLQATAVWWRIKLDPESLALDPDFQRAAGKAIATTEAWVEREPRRAEAWFYLGGAYAARVQWRVQRRERLAAARDGKRIKEALERALALDPQLEDAYFGRGMYLYYADVAPAFAKFLRWLLLLPGGDRKEGLAQMTRARDRGELLQGEADYQLAIICLWYEEQPGRALDLLQQLSVAHPGNPLFLKEIAEVQDIYFHDREASLQTWRTLLQAAERRRTNFASLAETEARLGLARQLDALFETDAAIDQLTAVVEDKPAAPFLALARAELQLGEAYDRLGRREFAIAAYRAAIAAVASRDPYDVADRARSRLDKRPDPGAAEAYRLSLEGWRLVERGRLAAADAVLARALELRPNDPVARYRYGRLLEARKDDGGALAAFDRVIRGGAAVPPTIFAAACLEAGRLLERGDQRVRAIEMYRRAATTFGGGGRTRSAAERSLARLQSSNHEDHEDHEASHEGRTVQQRQA